MARVREAAFRTVDVTPGANATQQATEICNLLQKGWEIVSTATMPGTIYYVLVLRGPDNS